MFARWISALFSDAGPMKLEKRPGRSSDGLRTINVKSRASCAECNSGWMSRAEMAAKPLLTAIFRGERVVWDEDEQIAVARWSMKTALMLDRSSAEARIVPAEHFSYLYREQAPPPSVAVYLSQYFPAAGEVNHATVGSCYRPTGVDPFLYPNPYKITFSVGQAIFEVFGHTGSAALEIRRMGYRSRSGLVVPTVDQFRQLWPLPGCTYEWPPQGGHLGTHNLEVLARL